MLTYHLSFGSLALPFSVQLEGQSRIQISNEALAQIQQDHDAANRLYVRGLITDKRVQAIFKVLSRQLAELLQERRDER